MRISKKEEGEKNSNETGLALPDIGIYYTLLAIKTVY